MFSLRIHVWLILVFLKVYSSLISVWLYSIQNVYVCAYVLHVCLGFTEARHFFKNMVNVSNGGTFLLVYVLVYIVYIGTSGSSLAGECTVG